MFRFGFHLSSIFSYCFSNLILFYPFFVFFIKPYLSFWQINPSVTSRPHSFCQVYFYFFDPYSFFLLAIPHFPLRLSNTSFDNNIFFILVPKYDWFVPVSVSKLVSKSQTFDLSCLVQYNYIPGFSINPEC